MIPLLVSLLVTFAAAPGVRRLMLRGGIIDVPNHRSSHVRPTPRGGGLACLLGVVSASLVAAVTGHAISWGPMLAAVALALIGLADDRFGLPAGARLSIQVFAGMVLGWFLGGLWMSLLGGLVFALVVNVVNFMDGINGITSLSATIWGAAAWSVGLAAGITQLWVIGAITLGAALGFLPWNAPDAKLFLGDVGSYLFGGLIAGGLLMGVSTDASPVVLVAPLAIYFVDTTVVMARRAYSREPVMKPHRDHVYQRLTRLGLPHIWAAALVAVLASATTSAWAMLPTSIALLATFAICAAYLGAPRMLTAASRIAS